MRRTGWREFRPSRDDEEDWQARHPIDGEREPLKRGRVDPVRVLEHHEHGLVDGELGKHLLGLINTVLDIAKIEFGQFTLNMTEYAIESVVETVRAATESLAQNKKLTLTTSVDKPLPIGLGDE